MTLDKLNIENENGEAGIATRADYIKLIVATLAVAAFVSEENGTTTEPSKVVSHILKNVENGTEPDPAISSAYPDVLLRVEEDVKRTNDSKVSKADEAAANKAQKEKEKAEREAAEKQKAEELKITQGLFAERVAAGADLAAAEFGEELKELGAALPQGARVTNKNGGFGIEFAPDATKETIGTTLGYLLQKADNSNFIANQLQFWIGDTVAVAVARGIYATAKEAGKNIATAVKESTGKNLELSSIDYYKRMAERTPLEMRNPKVQPTAYLAISNMKVPKKDEGEKDEAYKVRLAEFEKTREGLQMKLATGEITDRKGILPLIEKVLIDSGVKEAPSTDPVISISQQFQIYFHAKWALENLLDTHEQGVVVYRGEGTNLIKVTKAELEEKLASAEANLVNVLYSSTKLDLTPNDYIRGYVIKKVKTEVTKDGDGKPIMEETDVKNLVYPQVWYQTPKAEASVTTEVPVETAPEAAAESKKKSK